MKKVIILLTVAFFVGACHCTKCTTTPNRSNTCKVAVKKAPVQAPKPVQVQKPAPAPAPVPAPQPVAEVTHDTALATVATVTQKANNSAVLSFKEPIHFGHNSDEIQDDSFTQIRTTANVLKKYPNAHVRVAGHTDSLGDPMYNVDLSQRRAKSVADQLIEYGVSAENVSFIGYGADRPIATNKTKAGRAQNRRVELEVTNK